MYPADQETDPTSANRHPLRNRLKAGGLLPGIKLSIIRRAIHAYYSKNRLVPDRDDDENPLHSSMVRLQRFNHRFLTFRMKANLDRCVTWWAGELRVPFSRSSYRW